MVEFVPLYFNLLHLALCTVYYGEGAAVHPERQQGPKEQVALAKTGFQPTVDKVYTNATGALVI